VQEVKYKLREKTLPQESTRYYVFRTLFVIDGGQVVPKLLNAAESRPCQMMTSDVTDLIMYSRSSPTFYSAECYAISKSVD
jgi:hypothetical protein